MYAMARIAARKCYQNVSAERLSARLARDPSVGLTYGNPVTQTEVAASRP